MWGTHLKKFSDISNGNSSGDEGENSSESTPLVEESRNILLFEAGFEQLVDELLRRGSSVVVATHRRMTDELTDTGNPSDIKFGIKGCPLVTQSMAQNLFNLCEERTMSYIPPVIDYGNERDDDYGSEEEDYSEDD